MEPRCIQRFRLRCGIPVRRSTSALPRNTRENFHTRRWGDFPPEESTHRAGRNMARWNVTNSIPSDDSTGSIGPSVLAGECHCCNAHSREGESYQSMVKSGTAIPSLRPHWQVRARPALNTNQKADRNSNLVTFPSLRFFFRCGMNAISALANT
jgi:hypothetical protein